MDVNAARVVGTTSPTTAWVVRGLVVTGLAIGLLLLWVHASAWLAARTATVPLCGWAAWLDCDTVLNSPRWSRWLGVPVVALAVGLYVVLAWAAFTLRPGAVAADGGGAAAWRRRWLVMQAGSACAAAAAVWFIYVQIGVLGRVCIWCMAEHGVSLTLAAVVWSQAGGLSAMQRGGAATVGILAAAALIGGQLLVTPTYTTSLVVGEIDESGRYVEVEPGDGRAVSLAGGQVVLSRQAHPLLGLPRASRLVVEVIDYTCPRCRRFVGVLDEALEQLGPDYAALVLTYPLSHRCNPDFSQTDERHAEACELAQLAHAVWAADPAAFADYHHWLFAEQERLDADAARAEAERRVGADALAARLRGDAPAELVQRDLRIAGHLDLTHLPGVIVGDQRFESIPDDAGELAAAIRRAFE